MEEKNEGKEKDESCRGWELQKIWNFDGMKQYETNGRERGRYRVQNV